MLAVFRSLMAGGDRLLMEGHNGRTGSDVASCSRGIFLSRHKDFVVGGGKELEITRGFQIWGLKKLAVSCSIVFS